MTITNRKPLPLFPWTKRVLCEICGKTSYSAAGIHPQCAARAVDRARMDHLKSKQTADTEPPKKRFQPYKKQCPKCQALQHVRKRKCDCGHSFQDAVRGCGE